MNTPDPIQQSLETLLEAFSQNEDKFNQKERVEIRRRIQDILNSKDEPPFILVRKVQRTLNQCIHYWQSTKRRSKIKETNFDTQCTTLQQTIQYFHITEPTINTCIQSLRAFLATFHPELEIDRPGRTTTRAVLDQAHSRS